MNNLLSPAVKKGDLQRLNYNTIFGRGSAPDPLGELTTLSQTPESHEEGYFLPILLLLHLDPRAPHSPSELVPPLFRPKLRPWTQCDPTPL